MPNRRSVKRNNNRNNKRNSVKNNRSNTRGGVGSRPANKVSFAAKLGAFMCENQKPSDVVGTPERGFDNRVNGHTVNQKVFGILPFLHMNISKQQFMKMLSDSSQSMKKSVEGMCRSGGLERKLKAVKFNCVKQSAVGNSALVQAVCDSIENRWDMRRNGRAVLSKIERIQRQQAKMGIVPATSLRWCGGK